MALRSGECSVVSELCDVFVSVQHTVTPTVYLSCELWPFAILMPKCLWWNDLSEKFLGLRFTEILFTICPSAVKHARRSDQMLVERMLRLRVPCATATTSSCCSIICTWSACQMTLVLQNQCRTVSVSPRCFLETFVWDLYRNSKHILWAILFGIKNVFPVP